MDAIESNNSHSAGGGNRLLFDVPWVRPWIFAFPISPVSNLSKVWSERAGNTNVCPVEEGQQEQESQRRYHVPIDLADQLLLSNGIIKRPGNVALLINDRAMLNMLDAVLLRHDG